ncbi:MAG: NUDIX domain-containing protein [bacterium]
MGKIYEAVAVVFIFQSEIFAIKRQENLKAYPGYFAFPGGKIDEEDKKDPLPNHRIFNKHEHRLINALRRELIEELNFDIVKGYKQGLISAIDKLGHGVTPDFYPYRYSTHFFRIIVTQKIDFEVDKEEASLGKWYKPTDFLRFYKTGNVLIVPPVKRIIEILAEDINSKSFDYIHFSYDKINEVPSWEVIQGIIVCMPKCNSDKSCERLNSYIIGDEYKILVDPFVGNAEELKRFKNTLKNYHFDAIALTHLEVDRLWFVKSVFKKNEITLHTSQKNFNNMKDFISAEEINFQCVKEEAKLTKWMGKDVYIRPLTHDHENLEIYAENHFWVMIGDSLKIINTSNYPISFYDSLQLITEQKPSFIFPSRGAIWGGSEVLQKLLQQSRMQSN